MPSFVALTGRTIARRFVANDSRSIATRVSAAPASTSRVAFSQLTSAHLNKLSRRQNVIKYAFRGFTNTALRSEAASKTAAPKKGRTAGTKTTTKKTTATKKPATKKAATKKPAAKKPKKKAVKAKPKKKVLTPEQKAEKKTKADALKKRTHIKALKEQALLTGPKQLPRTAWAVVFAEQNSGAGSITDKAKTAAEKYKNLSASEREHYNQIANFNKAKNEAAYQKWISSFTPLQIREAELARKQLRKVYKGSFPRLVDERQVKGPRNAYALFLGERYSSGDFAGIATGEAGKLIGQEYKQLSASQKKVFEDKAAQDSARYISEYTSVYGKPPRLATTTKAAA